MSATEEKKGAGAPDGAFDPEQTRRKLDLLIDAGELTAREVADAVPCTAGVISQWRRGAYAGDNERIGHGVARFLVRYEVRRAAMRKLAFQMTASARAIWQAASFADQQRRMVQIIGRPGAGKTRTIQEMRSVRPEIVYVVMTAQTTPSALSNIIGEALKLKVKGIATELGLRICEAAIREHQKLVVIDDVDFTPTDTLQRIRQIADNTECGLVMVGTPYFLGRMEGMNGAFQQFKDRIVRVVRVPELEPADVQALVGHGLTATDARKLMKQMGSVRRLESAVTNIVNRGDAVTCLDILDELGQLPRTGEEWA